MKDLPAALHINTICQPVRWRLHTFLYVQTTNSLGARARTNKSHGLFDSASFRLFLLLLLLLLLVLHEAQQAARMPCCALVLRSWG